MMKHITFTEQIIQLFHVVMVRFIFRLFTERKGGRLVGTSCPTFEENSNSRVSRAEACVKISGAYRRGYIYYVH